MAIPRRTLLRSGLFAGTGAAASSLSLPTALGAPAFVRRDRPAVSHGVQTGDVTANSAIVWTRADRPARMLVEVSRRPDFRHSLTVPGPLLTPDSDLTGRVRLRGLPAGRELHYRVRLADPYNAAVTGEPATGRLRTAPQRRDDVRFLWSADLAGQGWGINPDVGGYRIFRAMAERDPDFFLCSGDFWYADGPLAETVTLPDGQVWRNVVTPEKAKVAETLAEYRGQHKYNLMDDNLRAFVATVPMINQWDDHEVLNNWYPGEILTDTRYAEKRVDVLAERARQALFEYLPLEHRPRTEGRVHRVVRYGPQLDVFVLDMRTYRDANGPNDAPAPDTGILGAEQAAWLKRELAASRATWKVIAADIPLGLVVPDGTAHEGVAQGNGGAPLGREAEIAGVLSFIRRRRVTNTVWLTADVHFTAAHYYDPGKAVFQDFAPFWEFVSGPLNAGVAPEPNPLDATFGPEVRFAAHAESAAKSSPLYGNQFFGEVDIDGSTAVMTVRLRDADGAVRYSVDLEPRD
ncbi:alkaline phosphatase D family protein [Streptomyces sp. WMMC500]|uniref:alkaline phosphatase D family protein n=1 Tax=Streptomyces sp. WMMC500 TaxID=3015154 RepID=UPI00248AA5A4|nr:alkaline phosphatase D family protein [Streptomyces sp. WMMC500]WBB57727.1 alkaline phosphatase D family protein [Streptomyces sp. WMMC500]